MRKLKEYGFKINPLSKIISNEHELDLNYKNIETKRASLDYDIDGIVYKVNDFKLQQRLGNLTNSPRWAVAHKFSAEKGISKIKIVIIKPITPNEFFTIFICNGFNLFDDNSKSITAEDQHTAVSNA